MAIDFEQELLHRDRIEVVSVLDLFQIWHVDVIRLLISSFLDITAILSSGYIGCHVSGYDINEVPRVALVKLHRVFKHCEGSEVYSQGSGLSFKELLRLLMIRYTADIPIRIFGSIILDRFNSMIRNYFKCWLSKSGRASNHTAVVVRGYLQKDDSGVSCFKHKDVQCNRVVVPHVPLCSCFGSISSDLI